MEDQRAFPSLTRAFAALAGIFVSMYVLSFLVNMFAATLYARGIELPPALSYVLSGAVELLGLGTPTLLFVRGKEARTAGAVRRDALDRKMAARIIAVAVLSAPMMNLLSALWSGMLWRFHIPFDQGMRPPQGALETVCCLLSVSLIAPVCEEEFFRGRFFAALEPLGTRRALALSTFFFALLHGQIGALPVHLCLGMILGFLLVRRRSIYASMLFHACYNAATVLLALLPEMAHNVIWSLYGLTLIVWAWLLYTSLEQGERAYEIYATRDMNGKEIALSLSLAAVFLAPYVLSILN